MLASTLSAFGQETAASTPTALSQLIAEAQANNPQISAVVHEARAARQMVPQATTLPDPKFTYQQVSVGSPKPFVGYTNSDFAYIGVGASQEFSYPGNCGSEGNDHRLLDDDGGNKGLVLPICLSFNHHLAVACGKRCNRRIDLASDVRTSTGKDYLRQQCV